MKPRTLIILCSSMVVVFTIIGFFSAWQEEGFLFLDAFFWSYALLQIVFFGGLGLAIAINLGAGLHFVGRVRSGLLGKGLATIFVLCWSAVGAILPPMVMIVIASSKLGGESAMALFLQAAVTTGISVVGFLAFASVIAIIRRQ
jgi:hypothetical protein